MGALITEAFRTQGRRDFLRRMFGVGAGVVLGDDVLDMLDRAGPRLAMAPGVELGYICDAWYEVPFWLNDAEEVAWLNGTVPATVIEGVRCLTNFLEPCAMSEPRLSVLQAYHGRTWSLDAIGAERGAERVIIEPTGCSRERVWAAAGGVGGASAPPALSRSVAEIYHAHRQKDDPMLWRHT